MKLPWYRRHNWSLLWPVWKWAVYEVAIMAALLFLAVCYDLASSYVQAAEEDRGRMLAILNQSYTAFEIQNGEVVATRWEPQEYRLGAFAPDRLPASLGGTNGTH